MIRFLTGDSEAIRLIASTPASILVGAIFVLSAALARTWNRKDLRAEPKFIVTPFIASLVTSTIFALMLSLWRFQITGFPQLVPVILGLFWMTAPIAWLYGAPFEKIATVEGAIKLRLWTLLAVSIWRVALMARAISVLFDIPGWDATVFVLVFGDIVALAAIHASKPKQPKSVPTVLTGMGSITPRAPRQIRLMQTVTGCLLPVLIIALLVLLFPLVAGWRGVDPSKIGDGLQQSADVSGGLWGLAIVSVLFWLPLLPKSQSRQRLRTKIEQLIQQNEFAGAVGLLKDQDRRVMPEHWIPPVQLELMGDPPDRIFGLVRASADLPADAWIRSVIGSSFIDYLGEPSLYWFDDDRISQLMAIIPLANPPSATQAAKVLRGIESMKFSLELFGRVRDVDEEDNRDDHESSSDGDPVETEDGESVHGKWPDETGDREQLRQWLEEIAAEEYEPFDKEETENQNQD